MDELVALFVFLNTVTEKVRMCGSEEAKKKRALTSVVTSRFRYSIQTRMGEFIDPLFV